MGSKVVFEVTRGALTGQRFEYGEKTRIFIGRQEDCGIVLPESTVSRYHCVLEITPPEVKLQDFYSLNGTYLNGTKIGQRDREKSLEAAKADSNGQPDEHIIHSGDVLGIGSKCELRCTIEGGEACASCGAALQEGVFGSETLPEEDERVPIHYNASGKRICEDCWLTAEKERLEKRIAEQKAKEEAGKKAAEEARLAAVKEREEEEARERERRRQAAAEEARRRHEAEERKKAESEKKRLEEEARRQREAEERKKAESEKKRLDEQVRAREEAVKKAEAERREAERLAAELAAQIAAKKPKQIKCVECGKPFTPTAPDNSLCPECLADRGKVLDAILKQVIGTPAPQRPAVPSPVEGYTKVKLLGKGGMGEVWKVQESGTGKYYALKTMLPIVRADASAVKLFLREAKIGEVLSHKNVVKTYQSGCADGTFYILMDLCEGGSVDDLMKKKGGKLSLELATWITLQVLSGLDYVHNVDIEMAIQKGIFGGTKEVSAKGVVHRDFKPGNIFLSDTSDQPVAMVADLGMAKAFDLAGVFKITKTGQVMGTPVFMPRQQAIAYKYAKPEVDVWAAAASYYNMLTGTFPKNFRPGKNAWQIIVTEDAVPIRDRNSAIPKSMAAVIDTALRETPTIGYQRALDFRKDLVKALPDNVKNAVRGVI